MASKKYNSSIVSAGYNTDVVFSKDCIIKYPDFLIEYIGLREVRDPRYAPGLHYFYDFEISDENKKKKVSWLPGGDIGPNVFQFGIKMFYLDVTNSGAFIKVGEWKDG